MSGSSSSRDAQRANLETVQSDALRRRKGGIIGAQSENTTIAIGSCPEILVAQRQRGNPLLSCIKLTPWKFSNVKPDFVFGALSCGLFLSLRYHLLHEDYIYRRFSELRQAYRLRVLFLHVDMEDNLESIAEITKLCLKQEWTLVCVWSSEEAARYLETYKAYEKKGLANIKTKGESHQFAKAVDFLTVVKSISKTDAFTLLANFKTVKAVLCASLEDLSLCPGLGPRKVRYLYEAFHGQIAATHRL
jgi:DNA excision repair protein ERCC-1